MLSNLPCELIRGILLRIEAKYLTKLRWVCKKWKALISDRAFIEQHLLLHEHDDNDDQHILTWDNSSFFSLAFDPPPLGIQRHTLPEIPSANQIKYMVHCDGLLLCVTQTKKLGVWNPCLRQFRWVPGTDFIQGLDLFGLGYNHHRNRQDGYKIVRFHDRAADNEEEESEEEEEAESSSSSAIDTSVKIFEFKTDTWRVVEASEGWSVRMPCLGVSLKGNYYWIAYRHGTNGWFIQSFDFSTETFKPLSGFLDANRYDTILLAGFRGDGLSLLHQCRVTKRIEVWVTNKIGCSAAAEEEEVWWSSLMRVESPETPLLHHVLRQNYSCPCFFVHKKKDELVLCCDPGEWIDRRRVCIFGGGEMREMDVGPRDVYDIFASHLGYVFVPTLVPLPHPATASVVQLQDP